MVACTIILRFQIPVEYRNLSDHLNDRRLFRNNCLCIDSKGTITLSVDNIHHLMNDVPDNTLAARFGQSQSMFVMVGRWYKWTIHNDSYNHIFAILYCVSRLS